MRILVFFMMVIEGMKSWDAKKYTFYPFRADNIFMKKVFRALIAEVKSLGLE
jgi:hypothetical protein